MRILDKDGLVATWDPPDPVSIAASCGSLLALVHANAVTVVTVKPASGQVEAQQTLQYPQQVSAIAILESANHVSQVRLCHDKSSHVPQWHRYSNTAQKRPLPPHFFPSFLLLTIYAAASGIAGSCHYCVLALASQL